MKRDNVFAPLALAVGLAAPSMAQKYTVTDLGTFPGDTFTEPRGINNSGQVIGRSLVPFGDGHAFLWLPEPAYGLPAGMNDLGLQWANALNDLGQVVGSSNGRAFVWQDGMTRLLNNPQPRRSAEALAINPPGHVVGINFESFIKTSYQDGLLWRRW